MFNLVLFGPPGSGKGTQSVRLADKYHLIHLSTGDMLRREIAHETPLGKAAKEIMDRGELVSDQIVIGMIENQLENNPQAHGFIFDGFPRTTVQAMALDELLSKFNSKIDVTLSLEVDNVELVKRLLIRGKDSGRADDRDETVIANRIKEYQNKTAPLIEYYRNAGKFRSVWGMDGIDQVFQLLCNEIDKVGHHQVQVGISPDWNESIDSFREDVTEKPKPSKGSNAAKKKTKQKASNSAPAKNKTLKTGKKSSVKKLSSKFKKTTAGKKNKPAPKPKKISSKKRKPTNKKSIRSIIAKKKPLTKKVKAKPVSKKKIKPSTKKKQVVKSKRAKSIRKKSITTNKTRPKSSKKKAGKLYRKNSGKKKK